MKKQQANEGRPAHKEKPKENPVPEDKLASSSASPDAMESERHSPEPDPSPAEFYANLAREI